MLFSEHIRGCRTAAPIPYLEVLIDRRAEFGGDLPIAGDITPCIEVRAVPQRDGTARSHVDLSVGTARSERPHGVTVLSADADRAVDCDGRTGRHGQLSKGSRRFVFFNRLRFVCVERFRLVKRDQQGDPGWDRIGSCDFAVGSQRDLVLAVCLRIGNRFVQIVKKLTAGFKKG